MWDCETCTFKNTVENWNDIQESICEMCETPNKSIKAIIESHKSKGKAGSAEP